MHIGATAAYTYAFRGTAMTLADYLESIATLPQLGLRWFDLEILQPQHIPIYEDAKNAARLHEALATHGVNVAGFTAWVCLNYIHSTNRADHEEGYKLFNRVATVAAQFKAGYIHLGSDMISQYIAERDPTYVTAPATRIAVPRDVPWQRVLDEYATRLAKLATIAASHGLKFASEPRANSIIAGADGFNDIHRRAGHPNLYCCYDVVHATYHRENVALGIEKLGSRLLVLQLCNAVSGGMTHLPLEEGEVEIDPILASLRKIEFDGYCMLELYRSGTDPKEVVDQWYRAAARRIQ